MRLLLCLLCAIGLAACDDPTARGPFTASRAPPGLPVRALAPEGWAWGLIQIGKAPPIRYGVAAPAGKAPRGQVLILPTYGEPAEAWFEAAQGLIGQGYSVWMLESAGQGGSARYTLPRDVGHAPDFQADLDALSVMRQVMGRKPTVFVAQGSAAPVLMAALRAGLPAQGVVLSAPTLTAATVSPEVAEVAPLVAAAHLDWLRAYGEPGWKRIEPLPKGRAGVIAAWQTANPDLRIGGPSWGHIAAFQGMVDALNAGSLASVKAPVLILHPGAAAPRDAAALCRRLARCALTPVRAGRGSLHLESDEALEAWTTAVGAFIQQSAPTT